MGQIGDSIIKINGKLDRLIDQHENIKKEKAQLQSENADLKAFVDNQQKQIAELENQLKMIKIAKQIDSGEGNKEVKQKINEFIREIDNCIALLNN